MVWCSKKSRSVAWPLKSQKYDELGKERCWSPSEISQTILNRLCKNTPLITKKTGGTEADAFWIWLPWRLCQPNTKTSFLTGNTSRKVNKTLLYEVDLFSERFIWPDLPTPRNIQHISSACVVFYVKFAWMIYSHIEYVLFIQETKRMIMLFIWYKCAVFMRLCIQDWVIQYIKYTLPRKGQK